MDVGEHTSGSDGDTSQKLVELLVVADGELQVARDDAAALVVAGGVTGQLQDLGGEVLEDGGKVHGGTSSDAGGVASLLQVGSNAANRELKSGAGSSRLAALLPT